jgi:Transposase, Mutator family
LKKLKKALIERALGAELTEHLGYEKGDPAGRGSGNSRNGSSSKTVLTETSATWPNTSELDLLDKAGEEGWELVVITSNNIAYFKRQIRKQASRQKA